MLTWIVNYEPLVRSTLHSDFKSGKLSVDDIKFIKRWVSEVERKGLLYAQSNKDWRDHELNRGQWKGCRAISFSFSGRVIYRVENRRLVVMIIRVTTDHNYR